MVICNAHAVTVIPRIQMNIHNSKRNDKLQLNELNRVRQCVPQPHEYIYIKYPFMSVPPQYSLFECGPNTVFINLQY